MKDTYHLVNIGRDTFIMLNVNKPLLNKHCNNTIFENKKDSELDTNVFAHFGLYVKILNNNSLDRRTKKFKQYVKDYGYFSAAFLPEIKKRESSKTYTRKFSAKQK